MNDRPQPGSYPRQYVPSGHYDGAKPPARRSALQLLPLALGAMAGVVLVVVVVTLFSHRSDAAQPPSFAPVARQLCSDLTTQRYNDLYGLLSTTEQALGTRSQFAASQQQLDAQLGMAHTCTYTIAGQDTTGATLTLTLTRGAAAAATGQARLTFEQNDWRIVDYDSSLVVAPAGQSSGQFSRVWSMSNGG